MKTVIGGALGTYLLLGAVAHAQPAHNPPSGLNPEPRFKLEALRFKALNETGLDFWPFSDEVYVSIHVPTHKVATLSKIYNDVDAGETNHFPLDQSCILPIADLSAPTTLHGENGETWRCAAGGAPGPFSFTVVFREKDPCNWGPWSCFEHGVPVPEGDEPPPINGADDLIGRSEVVYSMQELIALQVGQVLEESIWLYPGCRPLPCGTPGTDALYQFTWQITRLPDAQVATPVVD
jgi:hypothetical protein